MELLSIIAGVSVGIVFLIVMASMFLKRVLIFEHEKGVLFKNGKFSKLLEAGRYWVCPFFQNLEKVDMRDKIVTLQGQELLTADNVSLKVSGVLRFQVKDPQKAIRSAQSYEQTLYTEAQLLLREAVGSVNADDLIAKRQIITEKMTKELPKKTEDMGIEIKEAGIRDIMLPGSLKQIFAQVVEAKKAALASLEKARGEAASIRKLSNAARVLDKNPNLVTLKTLQTVAEGKNTLIMGVPQPVLPIKT